MINDFLAFENNKLSYVCPSNFVTIIYNIIQKLIIWPLFDHRDAYDKKPCVKKSHPKALMVIYFRSFLCFRPR